MENFQELDTYFLDSDAALKNALEQKRVFAPNGLVPLPQTKIKNKLLFPRSHSL